MKLLTLNTHSRPETAEQSTAELSRLILAEQIDVIALQEVNQEGNAPVVSEDVAVKNGALLLSDFAVKLREDNFALLLARRLGMEGATYHFCYLPIKRGYDRFDEGVALFWRGKEEAVNVVRLSAAREYSDWRKRMALGVQLGKTWFYSLHTSRFDDGEDPFPLQWRRMVESVQNAGRVFLMGDLNCPAECVGEGYDRILSDGWYDAFAEARRTKGRDTASGEIDGWGDQSHSIGIRIDYILTNDPAVKFCRCETVFDPLRGQVAVSDHCGVLCETEEELW